MSGQHERRGAWGVGLATLAARPGRARPRHLVSDDRASGTEGAPRDAVGTRVLGPTRRRRSAPPSWRPRSARTAAAACGSSRSPPWSRTSARRRPTRTTPTCACTCSRHRLVRAARREPRRRLRRPRQRRVDDRRPGRPAALPAVRLRFRAAGEWLGVYGARQVPAHDRLRRADRRADRRRRPRPARRAPRRGHHRDARGLRELQRRHARLLDGRGPDQRRRRGRRRLGRRRRRLDHGHAVGRRLGGDLDRRAAACSAPTRASGSRSATSASSRPGSTSPRARACALPDGEVVKARELSGADDLLFRRNSQTRRGRGAAAQRHVGRPERGAARAPVGGPCARSRA